jgi:hypothetical protein
MTKCFAMRLLSTTLRKNLLRGVTKDHLTVGFSVKILLTPQVMYLKLATFEPNPRRQALMYFNRPRALKKRHGFKVLIHIDVVEDLLFYHYPREELIADGKVPWRGFAWQTSRMDGELNEDELHPPTRYCGKEFQP